MLTISQVRSVLATNFEMTNHQRDVGQDSVMSSAPVRRSSAKERIATIGARTTRVVSMLE